MSAFTALRHVRSYMRDSEVSLETALAQAPYVDASYSPHDYQGAATLHTAIEASNDFQIFEDAIRDALADIVVAEEPSWLSLATRGRQHVLDALTDEASNEHLAQVFRSAGLLAPVPSGPVLDWWDSLAARARAATDARKLASGRSAELRSLEFERSRLHALQCPREPVWIAVQDNSAGFDLESWDIGPDGWTPIAIEVKSFSGRRAFYLTRHEYETAQRLGGSYRLHLWVDDELLVIAGADIVATSPSDGALSRWDTSYFVWPR